MSRAARAALYQAQEFDKGIVRQMHRFPDSGSYEMHMTSRVHEFFSDYFWSFHFELRFTFSGREYAFMGYNDKGAILDMTRNEVLELYGNVHALKSMLRERTFDSMQKWGAACQNALGGNISSMPLARRLFAAGHCYEDLILGAKAAREDSGGEVSELSAPEEDSGDDDSEDSGSGSEASRQEHPRWMSTGPVVPFSNPATSDESDGAIE
jgi:hypothetical protein